MIKAQKRFGLLLPLLITLGGFALRLFRLGTQSFWFDEAQTLFVARMPLIEIIRRTYRPPLYHVALHFWGLLVPDNEFWLRLPSALWGAAVPPLLFAIAARTYGRRVGSIAAALAAISPALIWYAQELRMYSLMASEFALLLFVAYRLVAQFYSDGLGSPSKRVSIEDLFPGERKLWLAVFLIEVASLYTHYFTIPFLLWLVAIVGAAFGALRRWAALRTWMGVQLATALAFVPWLIIVARGRGGTEDYVAAEIPAVMTIVPRVRDFLVQCWEFYTTRGGLSRSGPIVGHLSTIAAVALAILLFALTIRALWSAWRRQSASDVSAASCLPTWACDLALLGLVGGPFVTAAAMFKLRPGVVHPRHLMMIAVPLVLLMARVITWGWGRLHAFRYRAVAVLAQGFTGLVGNVALAALVGLSFIALGAYYEGIENGRPDVRGLAQRVAALTASGDVVFLPYVDYAFDYYFHGQAKVYHLETRVGDVDLAGWLLPRIQGAKRAVLLRWVHIFADGRDFLPWFLQVNGRKLDEHWDAERILSVYDLNSPLVMPTLAPAEMRADPLLLKGAYWPAASPADQPLPVALQWGLIGAAAADYKVSVRLLDQGGALISQADRVLLAEKSLAPTSKWSVGLAARSHFLLELPPGTPPVTYTLDCGIYSAQGALNVLNAQGVPVGTKQVLGTVVVSRPASFPATFNMPMTTLGKDVLPGLMLEGFALHTDMLRSGEPLYVTLYWRSRTASLPNVEPQLELVSASGTTIGRQKGHPSYGQYPFGLWQAGELVVDRREVRVLLEADSGVARLDLIMEGYARTPLQEVRVEKTDRQFALPPVQNPLDIGFAAPLQLKGFDVDGVNVSRSQPLRLTLYWQATDDVPMMTDYTVFTHLLDRQNRILAQHDGPPAGGRWPTTLWRKGQVIVDVHDLTFLEGASYEGEAILEVGMYDARTLSRLKTSWGDDQVILPLRIHVRP